MIAERNLMKKFIDNDTKNSPQAVFKAIIHQLNSAQQNILGCNNKEERG